MEDEDIRYLTREEMDAWCLELCRIMRMPTAVVFPELSSDIQWQFGEDDAQLRARLKSASTPTTAVRSPFPIEAPAVPNHTRTGSAKAGVNDARKVQCAKSKHHGFYPANESCPDCPPPKVFDWKDVKVSFAGVEIEPVDEDDTLLQAYGWYPGVKV